MRRWAGALLAVALGCAAPAGEGGVDPAPQARVPVTQAPTDTAEAKPPATSAPTAVPQALDWSGPRVGGGQVDGRALAGGDVALWFWAPW